MKKFNDIIQTPLTNEDEVINFAISCLSLNNDSFEGLKEILEEDVFDACVAALVISSWQSDGWLNLIDDYSVVLHIPTAMEKIGFTEISSLFNDVLEDLPLVLSTISESEYVEVINFVYNPRFKVELPYLNAISIEDRKQFAKTFKENMDKLDSQAEKVWSHYSLEHEGWDKLIHFINRHLN